MKIKSLNQIQNPSIRKPLAISAFLILILPTTIFILGNFIVQSFVENFRDILANFRLVWNSFQNAYQGSGASASKEGKMPKKTTENSKPPKCDALINPRIIKIVEGRNLRTDFSGEDKLMESIKLEGIKVPLEVHLADNQLELVSGERRLRAVCRANKEGADIATVPVVFV